MKKQISIILIILTVVFLVTGCTKKEAMTPNDFVDYIETKEFQTTNVKEQFKENPQVINAFIAQNNDMTYQIEYYEFDSEKEAITFYKGNKDIFKKTDKKVSLRTFNEDEHSEKFIQLTETAYSVVSRIDKTVIYLNIKPEYKEEVDKILLSIGY